jgi:hypothetical protein
MAPEFMQPSAFGEEFFKVGVLPQSGLLFPYEHASASMTQKSNGAWYLTKTYRQGSKVKREDLYVGKDSKDFQVCRKEGDAKQRKRQALRYCTERGAEAFKQRLRVRCLNPKCREVFELGVCPNCGRSQTRPMWEEWMQWKVKRYALLLAAGYRPKRSVISSTILPTSDVTERGGWSTVFSGNTNDVMDKRSRLASEKALDFAPHSARKVVPDYELGDYNDQDHSTSLMGVRDKVEYTEENGEEVAKINELSTTVQRGDESNLWEELEKKPKRQMKSESREEFLRNADLYRPRIKVTFAHPWMDKHVPSEGVTCTEYVLAERHKGRQ